MELGGSTAGHGRTPCSCRPCSTNSIDLGLPGLPALSSQLRDTATLCLASPSLHCLENVRAGSWENHSSPHVFPTLRDTALHRLLFNTEKFNNFHPSLTKAHTAYVLFDFQRLHPDLNHQHRSPQMLLRPPHWSPLFSPCPFHVLHST